MLYYTRGRQPMARGPNVALFKSRGAKKSHQKNLEEMAKNMTLQFFIFWPTYHKRLATPILYEMLPIEEKLVQTLSHLYVTRNVYFTK